MNLLQSKILIVDDEIFLAEYLFDILKKLGFFDIRMSHSISQSIKLIEQNKPDVILLDIRMENDLDGIELANQINEKYKIPFIYITAHSDKAILAKAMKTIPSGYITKPFKPIDIFAALNLTLYRLSIEEDNFFIFKDGQNNVKINPKCILYAQSEGNYIDIHCTDKKYSLRNSLEWLLEQLPSNQFMRVHRSFVINLNEVEKINAQTLTLKGIEIPVSRNHIASLRVAFKK
jgi:DNA-binding LytR/AlgR family response regulator